MVDSWAGNNKNIKRFECYHVFFRRASYIFLKIKHAFIELSLSSKTYVNAVIFNIIFIASHKLSFLSSNL